MSDSDSSPSRPEPGRIVRPSKAVDESGWSRWLPGLRTLREYRDRLAAARHRGRTRADDDAGAGRHCVRGGIGASRHPWPLRVHRRAARLRAVRSQPDPGAGAGLVARGHHSRRRSAAVGRRSASRHCARGHDGGRIGDRVHPGRRRAPGICHRASFQADPLRLHEWNRADPVDRPAAQALRFFGRRRRIDCQGVGLRPGRARRPNELHGAHGRRRHAGGHPALQGQQARARDPDRGGRRHRHRRRAGPGGARRRVDPGSASPRPAWIRDSVDHLFRYRPGGARGLHGRPRFIRRHQRALAHLRRANRHSRRPQSGDGGARGGQSGRGILSGLPRQQQRDTHSGGRGRGRQDAADRRRRRSRRLRCYCCWRRGCSDICPSRRWPRS